MSKQGHQPERFQLYTELKDGSGFTIAGSDRVYKFDRFGGWFDEYGNYYDADGRPEDPPSDDGESQERSRSHSDYEDEFEREFGRPAEYEEDETETAHLKNLERIAANISILQEYPANTPLRVHFRNVPYISRKEEVFAWAKNKVQGLLSLVFSFNQKGFSGKGYFVVENINAAEELLKLQGERYGEREIAFDLEDLQEFLLYPLTENELVPPEKIEKKYVKKSEVKEGPKKYVNVQESHHAPEKKVELKPIVIAETIKEEPKVEKKEEKKEEEKKKEEKKEEKKVNLEEFASYTFLKKAFPKKSSFKDWLTQQKINSEDFKQVQKIAGNEEYAKITMKRKVYEAINNTIYNGENIVFKEQ